MKSIVEQYTRFEYKPWNKTYLFIGKDETLLEFGTIEMVREKLAEVYGKPNAEKMAAGERKKEEFAKLPQSCPSNMYRITVAMHAYYDTYGSFPPAYTVDADGNKLHSWRTLLLPFLEQNALYKQIRLDEPWNSEHNRFYGKTIIPVYRCHNDAFSNNPNAVTPYSVVVGRETPFMENGKTNGFRDITDGTCNTVCLVERANPIPWMQPDDITFEEAVKGVGVSEKGIGNIHGDGCYITLCDGSVKFLKKSVDLKNFRAVLTKDGGESLTID